MLFNYKPSSSQLRAYDKDSYRVGKKLQKGSHCAESPIAV
jgi:hypothetical protein